MAKTNPIYLARKRRHRRVRKKVFGTSERPRLNVFRSLKHIYAQVIDDSQGHTLIAASSLDAAISQEPSKMEQAKAVGRRIGELAQEAGIQEVVFDRGGYKYHGRIKALAEASRQAGLRF